MARYRSKKPQILAIETSVTDKIYQAGGGNDALKQAFFSQLKELMPQGPDTVFMFRNNPRAGDNIMVHAEDFDHALLQFGVQNGLIMLPAVDTLSDAQKITYANDVAHQLFGDYELKAGGSLANSFDAMVHSKINGKSLVEGMFVSAAGPGPEGDAFRESLKGHSKIVKGGRPMVSNIIPTGKDRIIITTPSKTDPSEDYIPASPLLGSSLINADTDMVMLGGYLRFVEHFEEIFNNALTRIKQVNEERAELGRPPVKIVMTAAAQPVAEDAGFRAMFHKACATSEVIIHANTGEFRRLLDNDTAWRAPHNHKWVDEEGKPLEGAALEQAKRADDAYQADKKIANQDTIDAFAVPLAESSPYGITFVATNGPKGTYVVDADGYREYPVKSIDPKTIMNTVGAGDNFAAGFELGVALGLTELQSIEMARSFAAAAIQQDPPRLSADAAKDYTVMGSRTTVQGALSTLDDNAMSRALLQRITPNERSR